MSKYGSRKTTCNQGHSHPSQKEAKRCDDLTLMERAGEISNLEQQPRFPIKINGKLVCTYIADFRYMEDGMKVEDVKGFKTPTYRLKKKLVEASYPGVEVIEI